MPIQVPNLDDRSFDEILAEAVARIPVHTPEWNNFNDSDPGMTLVQLFAFMVDNLLYRANRIPEANRLKFLELLNIPLRPASAARGLVVFENERGPLSPLPVAEGTELFAGKVPFRTRTAVNILPLSAQVYYKSLREEAEVDPEVHASLVALHALQNTQRTTYYQTEVLQPPKLGQKDLPEVNILQDTADNALWLALLAPRSLSTDAVRTVIAEQILCVGVYPSEWTEMEVLRAQTLGQRLVPSSLVFEAAIPQPPTSASAGPTARYRRLTVESAEDVLETPGIIQVKLPAYEDIVPYAEWGFDPGEEGVGDLPPLVEDAEIAQRIVLWLRLTVAHESGGAPVEQDEVGNTMHHVDRQSARVAWVGINAARVIQALAVESERLGVGTGVPNQTFKVTNTPVIMASNDPHQTSAPGEHAFQIQIADTREGWQPWTYTDDLYGAKPEDKVYSLDPESGVVTFGDGLRGKRPPRGAGIRISYEYGGGPAGDVAIGAINKSSSLPGGIKVGNPVRTWGASAEETVVEGEKRIPSTLRHRNRLVTAEDFHEITRRTPGVEIGRVEVLPLYNPLSEAASPYNNPGFVTLLIVPEHPVEQLEPPDPTRSFLQTIAQWLNPKRLITTQMFILGPRFIQVTVSMGIQVLPGQDSFMVRKRVQDAIRRYLSPTIGGPELTQMDGTRRGTGWPLESRLYRQDLAAVAARVEGVRFVDPANVLLGRVSPDGSTISEIDSDIPFSGLQLPWLRSINMQEGPPLPLESPRSPGAEHSLPIPSRTAKC
ncbi:MAG: hypothetical protein OHK0046_41800 [Anaerolineae bacterium]